MLLARDRMGQKPLYYAPLEDGSLVFASELKAVLKREVAPTIDPTAVALYLTYGIPTPTPPSLASGSSRRARCW